MSPIFVRFILIGITGLAESSTSQISQYMLLTLLRVLETPPWHPISL